MLVGRVTGNVVSTNKSEALRGTKMLIVQPVDLETLKMKDDYVICGDNRWQRETGITDRHILGVLTAIVRNGETISVQDPKYLQKVHLWCDFFWLRAAILWMQSLPRRALQKLKRWMNRA